MTKRCQGTRHSFKNKNSLSLPPSLSISLTGEEGVLTLASGEHDMLQAYSTPAL